MTREHQHFCSTGPASSNNTALAVGTLVKIPPAASIKWSLYLRHFFYFKSHWHFEAQFVYIAPPLSLAKHCNLAGLSYWHMMSAGVRRHRILAYGWCRIRREAMCVCLFWGLHVWLHNCNLQARKKRHRKKQECKETMQKMSSFIHIHERMLHRCEPFASA